MYDQPLSIFKEALSFNLVYLPYCSFTIQINQWNINVFYFIPYLF